MSPFRPLQDLIYIFEDNMGQRRYVQILAGLLNQKVSSHLTSSSKLLKIFGLFKMKFFSLHDPLPAMTEMCPLLSNYKS